MVATGHPVGGHHTERRTEQEEGAVTFLILRGVTTSGGCPGLWLLAGVPGLVRFVLGAACV